MNTEEARHVLLWCTVINYALLLIWFLLSTLARNWLHQLWGRWFSLPVEQLDAINFSGIILYKSGVLFFNLVPLLALYIVQ
jgi:hypothetical protein